MTRRVVVTGLGVISPLGNDYPSVVASLQAGTSCVRAMPDWSGHGLKSPIAGPIVGISEKKSAAVLSKKLEPGMSDAALYCSLAALDAIRDAGLGPGELETLRCGCIVGSAVGSVDTVSQASALYLSDQVRRINPFTLLRSMSSSTSAAVANLLRIGGRSYSISSACATSAHNIGHAYELIRAGVLDRSVAGGGEDVSELIAASFQAMRLALSTHFNDAPETASRPFDSSRDGFVISGGGGILILEELDAARARGANIRAEVTGYAATSDGFDLVLPDPAGKQTAACMEMALESAGLVPADIDYVNCHATSTTQGDRAEIQALRAVFGDSPPFFSSTKSMTGHGLGAAGALELIYSIAMIEQGFMAPSINVDEPDPVVQGLPLVTEPTNHRIETSMSNNFGFGGTNACLILRRFDD